MFTIRSSLRRLSATTAFAVTASNQATSRTAPQLVARPLSFLAPRSLTASGSNLRNLRSATPFAGPASIASPFAPFTPFTPFGPLLGLGGSGGSVRTIFIETQATPNPDSLKFFPELPVLGPDRGTMDFPSAMAAAHVSPLASRLFRLPGVVNVFLAADFVAVTKKPDSDWELMKADIFALLMDFFQAGHPVVHGEHVRPGNADTQILPEDDEVVATVKELLETRIRPVVQEDGGDIVYVGMVDGIVRVRMVGSCSGCPSSSATLKQGIEGMLTHYVPEVVGVEQVEDEELNAISEEALRRTEEAAEQESKQ